MLVALTILFVTLAAALRYRLIRLLDKRTQVG
jgi:hypothetical protein